MPRFPRTGLILAMLFSAAPAQGQQDEPLVLDPDVSFDPSVDFGFDDNIFAGAFDEEEQSATEAWFEDFTIRISQSTSGQINNHSIDLGAFGKFPKQADLETNRLQFNVRYQNPIAPGWLIQGSMWYRVYFQIKHHQNVAGLERKS